MLKVGDKVRYKSGYGERAPHGFVPGHVFTVLHTEDRHGSNHAFLLSESRGEKSHQTTDGRHYYWITHEREVELVEESTIITPNLKESMSSIISKFRLLTTPEPERSFIKAGVMQDNGALTSDGKELLLEFLLQKNKTEFNDTVVQPLLAEDKK